MKSVPISFLLLLSLALTWAEESKTSEVTKLEVVDLGELIGDRSDLKISESQRKRDSGYTYNRPDRFTAAQRYNGNGHRQNLSGNRAKILTRFPSQNQRPIDSYGAPIQTRPSGRPNSQYASPHQNSHSGSHRNKFSGHRYQASQFSSQLSRPAGGILKQEVPSPIRHVDFVETSPIASQNSVPFGRDTANYLPPKNQELPTYSAPSTFVQGQRVNQQQNYQFQEQNLNFQNQNHDSNSQAQTFDENTNQGISDAAHFLAQNAQAISQLYGAPATDQNFAPNNEEFSGQNNQIKGVVGPSLGQNNQFQNQRHPNFDRESQSGQGFSGALPSYASGTLSDEESLEQIQSKEKDRLIVQLQTLLSQSRSRNPGNAEYSNQYAQGHGNYIKNQNLLAAISSQFQPKYNSFDNPNVNLLSPGSFGSANTAFGQAPFVPGAGTGPTFTLGYGLTTQRTPPTTTTTTTTTTVSPLRPSQSPVGDGTSQAGTSVSAPSQPAPGFPHYNGFVPSLIGGNNFVGNVPNYGSLTPGFLPASPQPQPAETSPTHFGLPIPQDPNAAQPPRAPSATPANHRPAQPPNPIGLPSSPTPVGQPVGIPVHPVQAVHPIHSIHPVHSFQPVAPLGPAVTQLHPVSNPAHGIHQFHPVASPVQPVGAPVHPILPAAPVATPIHHAPQPVHPAYGVQSAAFSPLVYKPVKSVYPVFYYPNLPYQVQKPALPTYPWSYAPSFAQTKPAQIWK
ncbi:leucine-rich repeat extensin-like protein 1 [Athalia rosae]|uniref:leucine-rich repeat extensin-like protein 1 n=1 Tax=Athalia rosae TaxID=37344 RepID=UPI002033CE8B|nr:leucine-rich repeat extensin-like protein 1 [Athalia rosae]